KTPLERPRRDRREFVAPDLMRDRVRRCCEQLRERAEPTDRLYSRDDDDSPIGHHDLSRSTPSCAIWTRARSRLSSHSCNRNCAMARSYNARMAEPRVWVFFYGSYINFDVLAEAQLAPERWEVAQLPGFELVIRPRANLVRTEGAIAWGIVALATHAELTRLYAHARDVLGEAYWPHPVVVETRDGALRPALTYLSHDMLPRAADPAYVARIAGPARRYGFPTAYVENIERFASDRAP